MAFLRENGFHAHPSVSPYLYHWREIPQGTTIHNPRASVMVCVCVARSNKWVVFAHFLPRRRRRVLPTLKPTVWCASDVNGSTRALLAVGVVQAEREGNDLKGIMAGEAERAEMRRANASEMSSMLRVRSTATRNDKCQTWGVLLEVGTHRKRHTDRNTGRLSHWWQRSRKGANGTSPQKVTQKPFWNETRTQRTSTTVPRAAGSPGRKKYKLDESVFFYAGTTLTLGRYFSSSIFAC